MWHLLKTIDLLVKEKLRHISMWTLRILVLLFTLPLPDLNKTDDPSNQFQGHSSYDNFSFLVQMIC
jgi:hypothetical protein